ncbi:hypothetical protein F5880DRAFT_1619552 [Lentinula raphanica]|nr:hypothetical protein F5880DRAFT_1619552 [Lentinula raphanica]
MARALRPDIPSRRARTVLSQVAPGMADLNPAPGVGRGDPPPLDPLDQASAGGFQANRALNGEQGVAARQRARLQLSVSSSQRGPTRLPSPCTGWDTDAFPADSDLFGEDLGDLGSANAFPRPGRGRESPPVVPSHSARFHPDFELEGGGTDRLQGRGPIPLSSPGSDVWMLGTFGAPFCLVIASGTSGALCEPLSCCRGFSVVVVGYVLERR